ncbi:MAG: helix-turn-helix transcriptional regulator [Agathobacter sp.]|nr:helix-turn-helix transcriptional regulator [Agathobacter sp.]
MFTMPTIDMVATGRNIMRLREAAGMTVRDIQDIFGFATPQAVYKWQHGTAMPTIDNLVVLAAVFDVTVDQILVVDTEVKAQSAVGEYLNKSISFYDGGIATH